MGEPCCAIFLVLDSMGFVPVSAGGRVAWTIPHHAVPRSITWIFS